MLNRNTLISIKWMVYGMRSVSDDIELRVACSFRLLTIFFKVVM